MSTNESAPQYRLPAFPPVAIRVLEMFADEEVAVVQLAGEIKVDPVLTAKILHVANSPQYRSKSEVSTLEHAISWLGKSEVASLVLSFKLESFATEQNVDESYFRDFWRQSFIQGCALSRIAEACGRIQQSEASVCGLLLDFGKLVLFDKYENEYCQLVDKASDQGVALHQLERQQWKTDHAAIGGALLRSMGLPDRYGEAALRHTLSLEELNEHTAESDFSLIAASVVSAAIGDFFCCDNQADSLLIIETVCREHLQLVEQDIKWLMECVRGDIEKKAALFSINVDDLPPISQLLGRANEQIEHEQTCESSGAGDQLTNLERENELLRKLVASLEDRVCRDPLTGVYNRDYFAGRLLEKLRAQAGRDNSVAILVIDIDDFKSINDGDGHLAGDVAISWTGRFIDSFFENGLVARYGGDEFIVLLDAESEQELQQQMQQLCEEIEARTPGATRRATPVTISVGAVLCKLDRNESELPNHVWDAADLAIHHAKQQGGNGGKVINLDNVSAAELGHQRADGKESPFCVPSEIVDRPFSLTGNLEIR
ncbi:MAG: HDOD domain-containing protein [Pirellulaceae bacterium]